MIQSRLPRASTSLGTPPSVVSDTLLASLTWDIAVVEGEAAERDVEDGDGWMTLLRCFERFEEYDFDWRLRLGGCLAMVKGVVVVFHPMFAGGCRPVQTRRHRLTRECDNVHSTNLLYFALRMTFLFYSALTFSNSLPAIP